MEENLDEEIAMIESVMTDGSFWNDKEKAQATIKRLKELKEKKEGVGILDKGNAIMSLFA